MFSLAVHVQRACPRQQSQLLRAPLTNAVQLDCAVPCPASVTPLGSISFSNYRKTNDIVYIVVFFQKEIMDNNFENHPLMQYLFGLFLVKASTTKTRMILVTVPYYNFNVSPPFFRITLSPLTGEQKKYIHIYSLGFRPDIRPKKNTKKNFYLNFELLITR